MILVLTIAACGGDFETTTYTNNGEFQETTDADAPLIGHAPVTDAQPEGAPVTILATVDDGDGGSGVLFVYLRFKNETGGADAWRDAMMSDDGAGNWSGAIPGDAADNSAGVNYYIEAVDANQNTSWAPTRGADDPFHYRVYPVDE